MNSPPILSIYPFRLICFIIDSRNIHSYGVLPMFIIRYIQFSGNIPIEVQCDTATASKIAKENSSPGRTARKPAQRIPSDHRLQADNHYLHPDCHNAVGNHHSGDMVFPSDYELRIKENNHEIARTIGLKVKSDFDRIIDKAR
jgi:hypothetical protein